MNKRHQVSGKTTLPVSPEVKSKLESIKGFDGAETWDHLLNWLFENRPKGPRDAA